MIAAVRLGQGTIAARLRNPGFDRIRYRRYDANVFLYAFDLVEHNGDDLLRDPLVVRRAQSLHPRSQAARLDGLVPAAIVRIAASKCLRADGLSHRNRRFL